MKADGYRFVWILIGDGPLREELAGLIRQKGVEKELLLLGRRENPYPYIKNCLIYVQPSLMEGFCISTLEAKLFRKPVVTTNVPGMKEQFEDGINGIIVNAGDNEALTKAVERLLADPEARRALEEATDLFSVDCGTEVEKLYRAIGL